MYGTITIEHNGRMIVAHTLLVEQLVLSQSPNLTITSSVLPLLLSE